MLELEGGGGRKNLPEGALAPGEDQPHHCSGAHSCSVVLPRKGPQPTQRCCKQGEKVRWRESFQGLTERSRVPVLATPAVVCYWENVLLPLCLGLLIFKWEYE